MKCRCNTFVEPTIKNATIYFLMGNFLYFFRTVFKDYYNLNHVISVLSLFILNLSIYLFLFSFLFKANTQSESKICCHYNFLIFLTFMVYIVITTGEM